MDPYKILGIAKGASPDEIRRAYRKKAAQYHPDKGGDAWVFQQVQDAYDELTGKKKKKRKKEQGSKAKNERPEASRQQYADPFDIPDPQPTYHKSQWKNKHKKKTKPDLRWLGIVGIVAAALLLVAVIVFASMSMFGGKPEEQLANVEVGAVDNPAMAADVGLNDKSENMADASTPPIKDDLPVATLPVTKPPKVSNSRNGNDIRENNENDKGSSFKDPKPDPLRETDSVQNIRLRTKDDSTNADQLNGLSPTSVSDDSIVDDNRQHNSERLPTHQKSVTPEVVTLFDGSDLSSWLPQERGSSRFSINRSGILSADGKGDAAIWSKEVFSNYILELDWKLIGVKSDQGSGVFVRTDGQNTGNGISKNYLEIQISENESGDFYVFPLDVLKTDPIQKAKKPRRHKHFRNAANPIGKWNHFKIICNGDQIDVYLNDLLVNSGREVKFKKGRVGLLYQDNKVQFRNIKLTKILDDD